MLYDLALWKLAAFLSRKPKPNFPATFANITQADVDRLCPNLNQVYAEVAAIARLDESLTERERREAALTRSTGPLAPQLSTAEVEKDYVRFCKRVEVSRSAATLNGLRAMQAKAELNFAKLPAIDRLVSVYETKLAELETAARELSQMLISHKEFYVKSNAPTTV